MPVRLVTILMLWAVVCHLLGCNARNAFWPGEGSGGTGASIAVSGAGGSGGEPLFGGSGGAPSCNGDCVPLPGGWLGPSLFAIGPSSDLPACPDDLAPFPGNEFHDGLSAPPPTCPVCQCGDSETACLVPTGWHASAAKCADAMAAEQTAFPAPPGWSGDCTTQSAVPAGVLCDGVPCVQSVTVQAPQISAAPCSPKAIGGSEPPPVVWATRARECVPHEPGACPEQPPDCRPPSGFSMCVYQGGDLECEEPYTLKHIFYRAHDDHRTCSPCDCGPPVESACIVFVSAHSDAGCGTVVGAIHVASGEGEGCFDVPAGFPLAAKTADVIAAQPGSCAPSGGEPQGTALPALPVTVCCREENVPE